MNDDDKLPAVSKRYQLLELVGKGGMGSVYKARDTALNKVFALKILNQQLVKDKIALKRFAQEADAASALTHANLATVYDHGVTADGSPFLVMDYFEGRTLEQELALEGYLDTNRAINIFIQIADAISDSHLKGVIHRDIKPSNIILERAENGDDYVKIVDFGIAKILPGSEQTKENLTQTGDIFGSPAYMSPEQCQGDMEDCRSDIYSLGCVMYETVTGIKPFAEKNAVKIIIKHLNEDAVPISHLPVKYKVPGDLELIITNCLARKPEQRYKSAALLLKDLTHLRDGEKLEFARRLPTLNVKPPAKKSSRIIAALAIFSALMALFIAFAAIEHDSSKGSSYYDARNLDGKSLQYFSSGQYDKAAPLLEFGTRVYSERMAADLARHDDPAYRQDYALLNENYQHIGKCHLMIAKQSIKRGDLISAQANLHKAQTSYLQALTFYETYGNYKGSQMPEFVSDFGETLQLLHDSLKLDNLRQLALRNHMAVKF